MVEQKGSMVFCDHRTKQYPWFVGPTKPKYFLFVSYPQRLRTLCPDLSSCCFVLCLSLTLTHSTTHRGPIAWTPWIPLDLSLIVSNVFLSRFHIFLFCFLIKWYYYNYDHYSQHAHRLFFLIMVWFILLLIQIKILLLWFA